MFSIEQLLSVKTSADPGTVACENRYGVVEQSKDGFPGMYIFPERFASWVEAEKFAEEQARTYPETYHYYVVHFETKVVGTKPAVDIHMSHWF